MEHILVLNWANTSGWMVAEGFFQLRYSPGIYDGTLQDVSTESSPMVQSPGHCSGVLLRLCQFSWGLGKSRFQLGPGLADIWKMGECKRELGCENHSSASIRLGGPWARGSHTQIWLQNGSFTDQTMWVRMTTSDHPRQESMANVRPRNDHENG